MPELAGCIAVTERLLALPAGTRARRRNAHSGNASAPSSRRCRCARSTAGKALAPAEFFADKRNIENPELYAVFPFRLFAFNRPNADLGARRRCEHRWDRGHFGWRQDDIFMAYLGLARRGARSRRRPRPQPRPGERFPAFWGPNYDWTPDQDHGGVLMKAFQSMLMQTDGRQIFLLPAWPKEWDVEFKLHAPQQTVVEGVYRNGKMQSLVVTPESAAGPMSRNRTMNPIASSPLLGVACTRSARSSPPPVTRRRNRSGAGRGRPTGSPRRRSAGSCCPSLGALLTIPDLWTCCAKRPAARCSIPFCWARPTASAARRSAFRFATSASRSPTPSLSGSRACSAH